MVFQWAYPMTINSIKKLQLAFWKASRKASTSMSDTNKSMP